MGAKQWQPDEVCKLRKDGGRDASSSGGWKAQSSNSTGTEQSAGRTGLTSTSAPPAFGHAKSWGSYCVRQEGSPLVACRTAQDTSPSKASSLGPGRQCKGLESHPMCPPCRHGHTRAKQGKA